jgi:hypothetical protein
MLAEGSVAVNVEVAWNPAPNAPVEELNGNAVIPFWLAEYWRWTKRIPRLP